LERRCSHPCYNDDNVLFCHTQLLSSALTAADDRTASLVCLA